MNTVPSGNTDLLRDATAKQLEHAVALNHRELFCREAIQAGGSFHESDGVTWTHAGATRESMILFPDLTDTSAEKILDKIMAYYLEHPPKTAGCWSLNPSHPADLGVRLLARGFQPGWWPGWMALDLEKIKTGYSSPEELQVTADNKTSLEHISYLPYANDSKTDDEELIPGQPYPKKLQRFIGSLHGEIVAHVSVFFTTGEYGVAGIYNMGVLPGVRNRGIGKAVLTAACLHAKENGYRYAVLNGTGRRMYQQIGFKWINDGRTWWLKTARLLAQPPSKKDMQLAEAIGRGDLEMLEKLKDSVKDELNKPITNGMSLMQLAVHCRQSSSAKWLLDHGVPIKVQEAWDLGWKDRAIGILSADPGQVNELYGEKEITILHEAADRNDIELAALALSADPDLDIKDKVHHGTALGWAKFLNRQAIAALIEEYTMNKR